MVAKLLTREAIESRRSLFDLLIMFQEAYSRLDSAVHRDHYVFSDVNHVERNTDTITQA